MSTLKQTRGKYLMVLLAMCGLIASSIGMMTNTAGLFFGRELGQNEVEVLLDYATPVYRDTSVGRFLYRKLSERGCAALVFRGNAPGHTSYMEKIGYKKAADGAYVLRLSR